MIVDMACMLQEKMYSHTCDACADDTGKLVEAFITFLYLDFIGSSITFVSMGQMCGILDDKGGIPHSNKAFIAGKPRSIVIMEVMNQCQHLCSDLMYAGYRQQLVKSSHCLQCWQES